MRDKKDLISGDFQKVKDELEKKAGLFITEDNLKVLRKYFDGRKEMSDPMGVLYKSFCNDCAEDEGFSKFILRLLDKRYDVIYIDGRWIELSKEFQKNVPNSSGENKKWLLNLGTADDTKEMFRHCLTVEEMSLSPFVLPNCVSVVIGAGIRPMSPRKAQTESKIDYKKELEESIDCAFFCYPAATEFRDGNTVHHDLLFIVAPKKNDEWSSDKLQTIKNIKDNGPYYEFCKSIYGEHNALAPKDDADYVSLTCYRLHKDAYKTKTKNVLKQVFLSANQEMKFYQLGTVFQLKGLGLGAFAFSKPEDNAVIENLYLECVVEVLDELEGKLDYIKTVNLINLPKTFKKSGYDRPKSLDEVKPKSAIKITFCNMDATRKMKGLDIGGTVFCGDSGSKVGNEGNRGMHAYSSDDPATLYTLLSPTILDPTKNEHLQSKNCISILLSDRKTLRSFSEYYSSSKLALKPSL